MKLPQWLRRGQKEREAGDTGIKTWVVGEIWAELVRPGHNGPAPPPAAPHYKPPPFGFAGGVIDWRYTRNIIPTMGKDVITRRLGSLDSSAVGSPARWLAVGSVGSHIPASTDTRLASEWRGRLGAGDSRLIGTYAHPTGSTYFTLARTFQAGTVTGGVREAGVFTRGSFNTGSMLNHGTFAVITKGASDTLKVTAKFTFT